MKVLSLIAALLVAAPALASGPEAQHDSLCGGWAPLVADCSTGRHTTHIYGVNLVLFGDCSALFTCFVGDLQIVLRPASGVGSTYLRTCSIVTVVRAANLMDVQCTDVGAFPAAPWVNECHARAYGSIDPAKAGSGLPGAAGSWTCRVVHDTFQEGRSCELGRAPVTPGRCPAS